MEVEIVIEAKGDANSLSWDPLLDWASASTLSFLEVGAK